MGAGVAVAEARVALFVGFAAIDGVLGSLEAAAEIAFVFVKIAVVSLIGFLLRIAQT